MYDNELMNLYPALRFTNTHYRATKPQSHKAPSRSHSSMHCKRYYSRFQSGEKSIEKWSKQLPRHTARTHTNEPMNIEILRISREVKGSEPISTDEIRQDILKSISPYTVHLIVDRSYVKINNSSPPSRKNSTPLNFLDKGPNANNSPHPHTPKLPVEPGHISSYISGEQGEVVQDEGFISFRKNRSKPSSSWCLARIAENSEDNKEFNTCLNQQQFNKFLTKVFPAKNREGKFYKFEEELKKYSSIVTVSNSRDLEPEGGGLYIIKIPLNKAGSKAGLEPEEVVKTLRENIRSIKNLPCIYKIYNGLLLNEPKNGDALQHLFQTKAYNCITPVVNQFAIKEDSSEISRDRELSEKNVIRRNPSTQVAAYSLVEHIVNRIGCENSELWDLFEDCRLLFKNSKKMRVFHWPLAEIQPNSDHHTHLYRLGRFTSGQMRNFPEKSLNEISNSLTDPFTTNISVFARNKEVKSGPKSTNGFEEKS